MKIGVIRLKWNILGPPHFWAGYATVLTAVAWINIAWSFFIRCWGNKGIWSLNAKRQHSLLGVLIVTFAYVFSCIRSEGW